MQLIRPSPSSTYNCFNTKGIKDLARLRLGLSHLCDHKLKLGFTDSLNPICNCGLEIKTTCHYLLHCSNFINIRTLLVNDDVSGETKGSAAFLWDYICQTSSLWWWFILLSDKHFNIKCICWKYILSIKDLIAHNYRTFFYITYTLFCKATL